MQVPINQSDTLVTSPLQNPQSKQLRKQQVLLYGGSKTQKDPHEQSRPDYESALDFADFIGLSPVNKIKRKRLSNVQRFFQTNNFKPQPNGGNKMPLSPKVMIKSDIENRKLNFFDLKHIFQQRSHSQKLQKSKQISQLKNSLLSASIQLKYSRITSAKISRKPLCSDKYLFQIDDIDDPQTERLRVQTAREISRRAREKSIKNKQDVKYFKAMQIDKMKRSKILKNISKYAMQNPEFKNQEQRKSNFENVNNKFMQNPNKEQLINLKKQIQKGKSLDNWKGGNLGAFSNQGTRQSDDQSPKRLRNSIKKSQNMIEQSIKEKEKIQQARYKDKTLHLRFKRQNNRFQYSFKQQRK